MEERRRKSKEHDHSDDHPGMMTSMLCDTHDKKMLSSKRVVTLLAFIYCSIGFFGNMFFDLTVESFMYETMAWVVLGGFGFTAAEKFTKR